ncbi:MAG: efflux RND transporter periplasmic adaptor subunit [Pseudomonadales bacterium]|nr:efflux RND transporter periplasmic adaptor subunit [Pseudomonadales bacterium]
MYKQNLQRVIPFSQSCRPSVCRVLFLLFISGSAIGESENEASIAKVSPVSVVQAIEKTMVLITDVRGSIESHSAPHIAAKVSAEVQSIEVDEGQAVAAGQLLAELEDAAFKIEEESANASIQRMEVLVENQNRVIRRNKELMRKKMISQAVVDDAVTVLKQFQAELRSAKSKLKRARYHLSHTKITSPVAGVIQQRSISQGDYVRSGTLLFHIVATGKLRARLFFPETLVDSVETGMQVELIKGKRMTTGKVTSLRPMLEEGSRALQALVDFENTENWLPGASVTAKVILEEHAGAVAVPERALIQRPAGVVVYRVIEDRVTAQLVTVGFKQEGVVEIVKGVEVGDSIVLEGAAWLTDGAKISVVGSSL